MAMKPQTRSLMLVLVFSLMAFIIGVTITNVNANRQTRDNQERIRREVASQVAQTNSALCDIFKFSAAPRPQPPTPATAPTTPFGKQLAEYNRQQAISQARGRELVLAAMEKYHC